MNEPAFPVTERLFTRDEVLQFRYTTLDEAVERIMALREYWGDAAEESGMSTAIGVIEKLKDEL